MGERLIKPYEISVWGDEFVTQGNKSWYKEKKIAVIGSDLMTGLNKVEDPVFTKKSNGEKSLTFNLRYKYFDPFTGNEDIVNPFAGLLVNERKVKLKYGTDEDGNDQWYDFVVKEHRETSEQYVWSYTCTDAFVNELSKVGYDVEFSADLNNNQGTAKELASKTIENTDWEIKDAEIGKQQIEEPIYNAVLVHSLNVLNIDTNEMEQIDGNIYLFYTYVSNKNGKFIQFIKRRDDEQYEIDSKNVITATNYRILEELTYENHQFKLGNTVIISIQALENRYQAYRLAYNHLTTYDPVMKRTVQRYTVDDNEIYKYTDYEYTTSTIITNFITNGEDFNIYENGTLQGWSPYTPSTGEIEKLELVTNPPIDSSSTLVELKKLSQIEGFLKTTFAGPLNTYKNTVFNEGIANHVSTIGSISKGDEFVFRWRAGLGDVESLESSSNLRLMVALYDEESTGQYGYKLKKPDVDNIILQFTGTPQIQNNEICNGQIVHNASEDQYVVDGVVQTVSTKYMYKSFDALDSDPWYVWDNSSRRFVQSTAAQPLQYYYLIASAQKSVSAADLSDNTKKIGIFIYTVGSAGAYYIQDIQLTRCLRDATGQPVMIGNIPTATASERDYYYFKPKTGAEADSINTYTSLAQLADEYDLDVNDIEPLYNKDSEKILSISESKSNCFNILQTIAETFECWIHLEVEHDENGAITLDENGKPHKYIYLKEYAGKDNFAGFKYATNINSIEREVNSDEIVTRLIVGMAQCDYTDTGYVSIQDAESNPSGESYILNFDYYVNQGLIENKEECQNDLRTFNEDVKDFNTTLRGLETERANLELAVTTLGSKRNVYTELVSTAKTNVNKALEEFEEITGYTYEEYQNMQTADSTVVYLDEYYIPTSDTQVQDGKIYYEQGVGGMQEVDNPASNPHSSGYYEILPNYTEEETVAQIIGDLYINSATINSYSGLLENVEQEYWDNRKKLKGSESYTVSVSVVYDALAARHVKINLSDYVPGFKFTLGIDTYESTVSKKNFDITTTASNLSFIAAPPGYTYDTPHLIIDDEVAKYKIRPTDESEEGIESQINTITEEKKDYINAFNNKYYRFIQEGTWNSTEYISADLYYLDALQISNTSSQPIITYTINVVEISEIEGYELYTFDAGEKSYIEDTEFFGWTMKDGVLTPAREEVIISEVQWHLENPENNQITVQNYKSRFEDLFQRLTATVQTVQYNEATYAKMSSLLDATGTINQNVLITSLNNLRGKKYNLTSDGSILIDGDQILVRNLINASNLVKIDSEGIRISSDGGQSWATAINGRGINIGTVYTGFLNTDEVIIGSVDNPSFRWDKSGISAFKQGEDVYDLTTYVRYDQFGLYGIKNGQKFVARTVEEVKEKAHFAVTWDGFFIRNSYKGGGKVQITSTDDIQVINADQTEKIKIGALEWGEDSQGNPIISPTAQGATVAPTLYGIRINNNQGDTVFKTGDDGNLTMTGTIYATAGELGNLSVTDVITVGAGGAIRSSNYSTTNNTGWNIDNNGAILNQAVIRGTIYAAAGEIGGMTVNDRWLKMNHIVLEPGVGIYSDIPVQIDGQNEPAFLISDLTGDATFNNATVRGHIEAKTGDFTGWVAVGDRTGNAITNPWIVISGGVTSAASDAYGSKAIIKTSNYQDGAGPGWMINSDGNAVFNNITARGAIKTAVFEYAEIQAVGGMFVFRPSSVIRAASVDYNLSSDFVLENNDGELITFNGDRALCTTNYDIIDTTKAYYRWSTGTGTYEPVVTFNLNDAVNYYEADLMVAVEKPLLFKVGQWCKISNYASDQNGHYNSDPNPDVTNILVTNGLSQVYKISKRTVVNGMTMLTLQGATALINLIRQSGQADNEVLNSLIGGALVDMGNKDNGNGKVGTANYGIGINSSDNTVNLPARAISLFETIIDERTEPKISYQYRGIFGTLPTLNSDSVHSLYSSYMAGTQGVYTDNIYIGDKNNFIAFYKDATGRHLRIAAKDIVFDVSSGTTWEDKLNEAADQTINVIIESSAGTVFKNSQITSVLTCRVMKGNIDITDTVKRFVWTRKDKDGVLDPDWSRTTYYPNTTITASDIQSKAIFLCEVSF